MVDDVTMDDIRAAFDDLDWRQLAIVARQSPTRRLQTLFELNEFARNFIVASERQRQPDISDEELKRRVRERIQLNHVV